MQKRCKLHVEGLACQVVSSSSSSKNGSSSSNTSTMGPVRMQLVVRIITCIYLFRWLQRGVCSC